MAEIIIASKNKGKISEIKKILSLKEVELLDLSELSFSSSIEESGITFRENALIKAETVFSLYKIPVIADDSGLSVWCLGGKPGVFSARFAGPDASDEGNNRLLLEKLQGIPDEERTAWFCCAAIFYHSTGKYFVSEGKVDGEITQSPVGKNGFGYDPIFFIPEYGKTMAQLSAHEKNRISHRALAFRGLKKYIEEYLRKLS